MKFNGQRGMVPDDWKKLPSGLYVKVWTASELDPENRKIIVGAVHEFVDDMGWRIVTRAVRRQTASHDPSRN